MRARFLICALAVMALGFGGAVSADTLTIYDHFDNPANAINTTNWAPWGVTGTVADSKVTLAPGTGSWSGIDSTAVFGEGTYEFKYAGGIGLFGFEDAATGVPFVVVRNDMVSGHQWKLDVNGALGDAFTAAAGDVFDLTWSTTGFELAQNGNVVSSVSSPVAQQLSLMAAARAGTSLSLDYVGIRTVPEPSTLVLLSAGLVGLLAYASKKRR